MIILVRGIRIFVSHLKVKVMTHNIIKKFEIIYQYSLIVIKQLLLTIIQCKHCIHLA